MAYILTNVLFRNEELCSKVIFDDDLAVLHSQSAYSGKHKVLGNLICKSFHGDEENIGSS